MIAIKTNIEKMPEYCDDCRWYGCRPHPMKGWSDLCELMNQCLDDDQEEGWIIADVMVCIDQIKNIYNISDSKISELANYKINRQRGRMKRGE